MGGCAALRRAPTARSSSHSGALAATLPPPTASSQLRCRERTGVYLRSKTLLNRRPSHRAWIEERESLRTVSFPTRMGNGHRQTARGALFRVFARLRAHSYYFRVFL